jgi:hypothetical protein
MMGYGRQKLTVAQLKQVVLEALYLLGAIRINSNVGEA